MSSLFLKYNLSQFRTSSISSLFQTAININELLYEDLPEETFSDRLKKAKLITGLTQKELSEKTGVSLSTINELEAGYRDNIQRDTLLKLLKVLDKNILCDDYLLFILNQENNIRKLIFKYGTTNLCKIINCHHSQIYRWRDFKYQVSRKCYEKLKLL